MARWNFALMIAGIMVCSAGCSLSSLPDCYEGETRCGLGDDNKPFLSVCRDGEFVYSRACDYGCHEDKCAEAEDSTCAEGEKLCADPDTQKMCKNGKWSFIPCSNHCEDGECAAKTCEASDPVCSDAYHIERCIEGITEREECGNGQECKEGLCLTVGTEPDPPTLNPEDETPGAKCDETYIAHCSKDGTAGYNCINGQIVQENCTDSQCIATEGKASCEAQTGAACSKESDTPVCSEDKKTGRYCIDGKWASITCEGDTLCSLDETSKNSISCKDPGDIEVPQVCDALSGDTFVICSGKGILEYKNRTKFNIKKIIFKGDINLADALKPDMDGDSCEWKDWKSMIVPDGTEIIGLDNATIKFIQGSMRCTLPQSFFYDIIAGKIEGIHFDIDYAGTGAAVLVNTFKSSVMENVTITGNATQLPTNNSGNSGNSGIGDYALIKNGEKFKLKDVTIDMTKMWGYGNPMGGVIGKADGGELDGVHITFNELINHGANAGLGGIIGEMSQPSQKMTISNTSLIINHAEIQSGDGIFGGVIHQTNNIDLQNVYVQLDNLNLPMNSNHPANSNYSGALIGKTGTENIKINVSKSIVRIKHTIEDEIKNNDKIAGIMGTGDKNLTVKDTLIISDSALYGTLIGKTNYMPALDKVIVVSPENVTNIKTWPDNINIEDDLNHSFIDEYSMDTEEPCSKIGSLYFYTAKDYYQPLSCNHIHPVDIMDENYADDLLTILNADSGDITWTLKDIHFSDFVLSIPVFEAAGHVPE